MSTTNSNSLDSTSGSSESSVGGDQSGGSLSASTTISNMTAKCHPMPPLDMTDTADSAAPTPPPEMDDQLDGASVSRQSHQLSRPNSLEHYDTNHTIATDETTNTNSNNISEQSNNGQQQSSDGQNENENNAVVSSATVLVASAGESVQQLPSLRIAQSDSSGLSRHYITGTSNSNNNTHNHTTLQKALSVIERKSSLDANTNISNSSGLTTRSPMDVESSVIIQKQLDRIESLEDQLEHIKMERDSLLAENERLCFQLQMMSEAVKQQQQQQQRSLDPVSKCDHHHHQPPPPPAVNHCSCGAPLESVSNNSPPVELSTTITGPVCHCDCSSCPALVFTGQESTELAHHHQLKHPLPLDPSLMLSNVSLVNGQDLSSYACPNEQPLDGIRSSKSVSSFSSFKTTVDNYEVNNGTSHEASPHHPHLSNHYLIHNGDKRLASSSLSPCMHPECINPTTVTITSPTSSCQSRHKGVLLRTSAVSSESYISQMLSPVTPTLSPSISKSPLPLSASLNLSPTSATSPLFGYATTSPLHPLSRTARTGGGSSTSLTSATNGATYGNYELSQQLQDKHTSALERKYGGREARDAAIKIQRAFRSYRLQKRFTTLAIQAICHQQLKLKQQKEEEEAHKLRVQQKQQQQQPFLVKEESVIEVPRVIAPKLADTLKVDSMNLAPIDREAMQHRFSRKMSANYALEDLARMQSLQSQHQQQQQSSAQGGSGGGFVPMHQHQTYLTIPRQSSPPVTLVTSYEPVYHPPPSILYNSNSYSNHHHHHHQHHTVTVDIEPQLITKPLKKKTSFSSTSSTASSSSLHASSSSSKPSELTSSNSRLAKESIMLSDHNRLHTTRSQSQLAPQHSTKQRSVKGQQQQQPYQAGQSGAMSLAPNGAPLGTIHKTSTMSHHLIATNGAPNTVSFAPNVDFVNNLANTTEAVTSSVDAYRKRQYRVGLNLFNKNPSERGIRFLIANGYIEQSEVTETQASTVAHFLLTRKGLSRQMIGEYIAEPAAFNQSVLKYFCSGVNLSGIIVDEALRAFQVHFRFPGEAQKIERLVEAFADRYKECNPGDVLSRDSIFILAFAIIMLNTDLHKPTNIKHRMTPEQWLANLKGVFSEGDLSSQFLLGIYKRIKKQELQTGGDHVTQVLKVQSTIVGKDVPNLCLPHRRLVCYCRLYEIRDLNRREKVGQHQRDVFLFNDLLLITKTTSRSRNGQMAEYQYRSTYSLDGLQVLVFSTPYYPNGIRISRRVDNKIIACFNARNDLDQQRFVDDLQEAINEMDDMEQMRITKSSSLVQLNTLATGKEGNSGAGGHHGQHQQATAQSSTVIASPTDMATSYNSSLNSSVNYGQATNSSNNSNGCATQARASAAIASYPYNPK